tara:strand:- start:2522 stop:3541 length:1020 start_codon:yes stop_codon:yes gene_type:complete
MRISLLSVFLFFISCNLAKNEDNIERSQISLLSEKINKNPSNTDYLLERAIYNLDKHKYESALFDLKQCLLIDSLNSKFNYLASQAYFEISKHDKTKSEYGKLALQCIRESINSDQTNYLALALHGEINIAYARYKEAIDLFNRSLEIEYNQFQIHHLMGYAFKQLNQHDIAINCFQNSININPSYIQSYIEIGLIYQLRNDTLTEIYYNNVLDIDSSDIITLYNLALYYQDNQLYNKALVTYNKLLVFDAFNTNTHFNIGFIHMELKLFNVAVNNFADAIYSNSVFYQAYYARGVCFETLGNIAQAEVDYRRAVEIKPDYTYAIDALEVLNNNNIKYK